MSSNPEPESRSNAFHAALVVAAGILAYLLLILYHAAPYDYNPSCMIRFGAANPFHNPSALEPNLIVFNDPESGGDGYDGQFYYYVIKDFFMGEDGIPNPFRSQRILYPALAYLLAFGQADLLPVSMPAVNLLAIALSTLLLWRLTRDSPMRVELVLVYTLNIGFLVAVFYDVATPLCVGLTVGGAHFYYREKLRAAAGMLALAMLAQENALLVIAGFGMWLAWKRNWLGALTIAAAAVPWALWQALLWHRYGMLPVLMSSGHFQLPFLGMASHIISLDLPGGLVANLRELSVYPFMAFIIALLAVSILEMRKRPSELGFMLLMHALAGICFNQEQIWSSTITSPARALATVFPFLLLCYARRRSSALRLLIVISILLSLMGIARILLLPVHPYFVTQ